MATARRQLRPVLDDAQPGDLETRLRELEQQFEDQRFQFESLQQQLDSERQARQAVENEAQTAAERGYTLQNGANMSASWFNGLEFRSPKKDFYFHIGGRTQFDGVWMQAPGNSLAGADAQGAQDAVDFRRGRLRSEGTMYELIDWCVEYNFVGVANLNPGPAPSGSAPTEQTIAAVPSFTDLWWNFRRVPVVGNFTIGNIKEPFGLERLQSSRFLDFMERNFAQDAFIAPSNNGFAPGILVWNYLENKRMSWAAGLFKNVLYEPFAFGVGDGEYAADGRVTFAPIYDEASGGRYVVHVGMGASVRGNDNGQVQFRSRGSLRNGPDGFTPIFATTGFFKSKDEVILNPETIIVWGPWTVQAEFTGAFATKSFNSKGVSQGTVFASGYYAEALYFLTGEHKIYDYQKGLLGRVIPYENAAFTRDARGRRIFNRGAWQIGARYNELNLNDKGINGGRLRDLTLGLNWFLNPNMKFQWNVTMTHRDGPNNIADGNIYAAGMRVAHDF